MRIISSFKDYYDFIYPEGGFVYKRMSEFRTVDKPMLTFNGASWQSPSRRFNFGFYKLTPKVKRHAYDNHPYQLDGAMVVLNGEIIHKFLVVNMGGYPTEYRYFHNIESLLEKFNVNDCQVLNYYDNRLAEWFFIHESDKYGCQQVDDVPLYISYTKSKENVLVNPCLMQLGITDIDPTMLIQEIENFLHEKEEQRLNQNNPTGDDTVLRNSKGFDNNSFKHRT